MKPINLTARSSAPRPHKLSEQEKLDVELANLVVEKRTLLLTEQLCRQHGAVPNLDVPARAAAINERIETAQLKRAMLISSTEAEKDAGGS